MSSAVQTVAFVDLPAKVSELRDGKTFFVFDIDDTLISHRKHINPNPEDYGVTTHFITELDDSIFFMEDLISVLRAKDDWTVLTAGENLDDSDWQTLQASPRTFKDVKFERVSSEDKHEQVLKLLKAIPEEYDRVAFFDDLETAFSDKPPHNLIQFQVVKTVSALAQALMIRSLEIARGDVVAAAGLVRQWLSEASKH